MVVLNSLTFYMISVLSLTGDGIQYRELSASVMSSTHLALLVLSQQVDRLPANFQLLVLPVLC